MSFIIFNFMNFKPLLTMKLLILNVIVYRMPHDRPLSNFNFLRLSFQESQLKKWLAAVSPVTGDNEKQYLLFLSFYGYIITIIITL